MLVDPVAVRVVDVGAPLPRYSRKSVIDQALERTIADQLAAGDRAGAAGSAVRGYGPQILGYLRATLPADDAEEAFSIFCEFLWTGLPKFRAEAAFLTWSYQLAWGAVRRILENPHRRRRARLSTGAMEALAQEVRSTTAIHLRKDVSDQLARLRASLDPTEQTLLVLRIDRDLPWSEVATIMELDEVRLRKRFERLKQKIKRLADAGDLEQRR